MGRPTELYITLTILAFSVTKPVAYFSRWHTGYSRKSLGTYPDLFLFSEALNSGKFTVSIFVLCLCVALDLFSQRSL
jgi:hypothetical protein